MKSDQIISHRIIKVGLSKSTSLEDKISIEEPLEIRVRTTRDGQSQSEALSITMRTPGDDKLLALGFLFTEGIIFNSGDVLLIKYTGGQLQKDDNVLEVSLRLSANVNLDDVKRNFYTSSSCGVCGKSSIDLVKQHGQYIHARAQPNLSLDAIKSAVKSLQSYDGAFSDTGGMHAVGLFNNLGDMVDIREDVGRHNAMDKVVGNMLKQDLIPGKEMFVVLSGRASFELVQKAHLAGISTVVAIGAPSSLAIQLAEENGMTLIGFAKEKGFNIYSDHDRLDLSNLHD